MPVHLFHFIFGDTIQDAVDVRAFFRVNVGIQTFGKAVVLELGRADCLGTGTTGLHLVGIHVGAIREVSDLFLHTHFSYTEVEFIQARLELDGKVGLGGMTMLPLAG